MFANDIKIYTTITFMEALTLQSDLDKLCNWAKEWLLRFNISKCKHLKYGSITSPYEYSMDDDGSRSKLDIVLAEKDLGVWITSRPDLTLQCDSFC